MSNELINIALKNLVVKRAALQKAIDVAVAEPVSFSIQGSVSATQRSIAEMRAELDRLDKEIASLVSPDGGIRRSFPNYNC